MHLDGPAHLDRDHPPRAPTEMMIKGNGLGTNWKGAYTTS